MSRGYIIMTQIRVARWYLYFQTQNSNLGKILEGLRLENVGIFHGHLEYITAIWYTYLMAIWNKLRRISMYILWSFGNFVLIWYIFPTFW
jgi:hypothetical protein